MRLDIDDPSFPLIEFTISFSSITRAAVWSIRQSWLSLCLPALLKRDSVVLTSASVGVFTQAEQVSLSSAAQILNL